MDLERKAPAPVHQPILKELVIADLQDAARSGMFEKDILLFVQDGYCLRTLSERSEELNASFVAINAEVLDLEVRAERKRDAVVNAVRALYVQLKEDGDETTGVRGYAGAAGMYLNGAIVDYQTFLRDTGQHLEQSVQVGHTPDLPWLAAHTYAVLARASSTVGVIEANLGAASAATAEKVLGDGIRSIGSATQSSVATALGVKLWRMVEAIDRSPMQHVASVEADQTSGSLDFDLLDFEPSRRADFEP